MRIAVIAAGLSGLTAARTLQDQGHRVAVFEKSRGPGGRAATRLINELQFDHGAQYFIARDPAFQRAAAAWRERGLVTTWNGLTGRARNDRIEPEDAANRADQATPGSFMLHRRGRAHAAKIRERQTIGHKSGPDLPPNSSTNQAGIEKAKSRPPTAFESTES